MIKVKDNIFNEAQLSACNNWLDSARWSFGWPSNENIPYGHWNIDISRTPRNNTTDISERLPNEFKDVWTILNKEFFKDKATLVDVMLIDKLLVQKDIYTLTLKEKKTRQLSYT